MDERLTFSVMACERCGGDRVLSLPCRTCDLRPPTGEVNGPVVRRRQIVARVNALLAASSPSAPLPARDSEALQETLKQFLAALTGLLQRPLAESAVTNMATVIKAIEARERALAEAPRFRPSAGRQARLHAYRSLLALWPLYSTAMTTADIAQAQRLSSEAQSVIDEAPRKIVELAELESVVAALAPSNRKEPMASRLFSVMRARYPSMALTDMMRRAQQEASEFVGRPVPEGSALEFSLLHAVLTAYMLPDVARTKLQETLRLASRAERVRVISSMDNAVRSLGAARRDIFEILAQFDLLVESGAPPAALMRRWVKTIGDLYEATQPLLVWARLLSQERTDPSSFMRFLRDNSTDHVNKLRTILPETTRDLPSYLRHAAHHGSAFEVLEERMSVAIDLKSHSEIVPFDDFIDRGWAMLESVLALNWAVGVGLEEAEVSVALPESDAAAWGLGPSDLASTWLEARFGPGRVQSEVGAGTWTVRAARIDDPLSIAVVLMGAAEPSVHCVDVAKHPETPPGIELHWEDVNAYGATARSASGLTSGMALVELRHTTFDGSGCVLRSEDLEFVTLGAGLSLMQGDLTTVPHLRRLLSLAKEHRFAAAEALAAEALKSLYATDNEARSRIFARRLLGSAAPAYPSAQRVRLLRFKDARARRRHGPAE